MCYHAKRGLRGFGCWGFFWPCCIACGISVPQPGIESGPQQWKSRILTTGSPGNSWGLSLLFSLNLTMSCSPIWKVMSSVSTAHLNQLCLLLIVVVFMVIFPGGSAGKESCLQCRRPQFDSWIGKIHWRRERLPTPAFWPGELHGLYSPWGGRVGHDWATSTFMVILPLCTGSAYFSVLPCCFPVYLRLSIYLLRHTFLSCIYYSWTLCWLCKIMCVGGLCYVYISYQVLTIGDL